MDKGWNVKVCIELGAALSVCALSYYNAYGFILCSVFFFCGSILLCEGKRWNYKKNAVSRDTDHSGHYTSGRLVVYSKRHSLSRRYFGDEYIFGICRAVCQGGFEASNRMTPQKMGMGITDMFFWIPGEWKCNWLTTVAVSFVGTFGFMDIFMPRIWSAVYCLVYAVGILGMLLCIRQQFFVSGKEKEVRRRRDKSGTTLFITIRKERRWDTKNLFHICMLIAW